MTPEQFERERIARLETGFADMKEATKEDILELRAELRAGIIECRGHYEGVRKLFAEKERAAHREELQRGKDRKADRWLFLTAVLGSAGVIITAVGLFTGAQ